MNGLTECQAFRSGQIKIVQRQGSNAPVFVFSEHESQIIGQRRFAGALSSADTDKQGFSANKAITKDGGVTWELVAQNKPPHYVSCVQYVPETEGKEIFAVSTNGIFFSNNSGLTWLKVYDEGYYSIRLANKNIGWLSGFEKIAKMNIK